MAEMWNCGQRRLSPLEQVRFDRGVAALKQAVASASAGLAADRYPAAVASAWLCVLGTQGGHVRANLLVCLDGDGGASAAMSEYAEAFVDDSDDRHETRAAFLAFKETHATPCQAVAPYLKSRGSLQNAAVFATWLRGVEWAALEGNFCVAHSPAAIAARCLEGDGPDRAVLAFPPYALHEPGHADFLPSLGFECDSEAYAAAFVACFRPVHAGGAPPPSKEDLDAAVDAALRANRDLVASQTLDPGS